MSRYISPFQKLQFVSWLFWLFKMHDMFRYIAKSIYYKVLESFSRAPNSLFGLLVLQTIAGIFPIFFLGFSVHFSWFKGIIWLYPDFPLYRKRILKIKRKGTLF